MRDGFAAGMLVTSIVLGIVIVIALAAFNDTVRAYQKQQEKWVEAGLEAGALQYNAKTGKIEPVRCEYESQ